MSQLLDQKPKYEEIKDRLVAGIRSGKLSVGDRLPTLRALTDEFGVSYTTASRAVAELVSSGCATARVGKGTFVVGVPAADSTSQARTNRLGLLVCGKPEDEYYAQLAHHVHSHAWSYAHSLSYCSIERERWAATRERVRQLADETDGLIVTGWFDRGFLEQLKGFGRPIVALGYPTDGLPAPEGVDAVVVDIKDPARDATRWLLAQGHRSVCFIKGGETFYFNEMEAGYREAMAERGIDSVQVERDITSVALARKCAARLLSDRDVPSALVVSSHMEFKGLLPEFVHRGVRIPADMAVVVVSHRFLHADSVRTPRVMWRDGAEEEAAVRLLMQRISDRERPAEVVRIPASFSPTAGDLNS